jgi:hypothetical protein
MPRSNELSLFLAVQTARKLTASESTLAGAVTRACLVHGLDSEADCALVLAKTAEAVAGVAVARLWIEMDRRESKSAEARPTVGRPRQSRESGSDHDAHQPESVA